MVALIGILAYFDIHISARLLGIALISEVLFLLIFDVVVFGQGGENIQAAALNPVNAFKNMPGFGSGDNAIAAGAWAVGVFFAFWSWVGFEMAPNYGEESKNPKKIVPMAMYISVIGLGVFYVITSWAAISGYATTEAAATQAVNNAAGFFLDPAKQFGNTFLQSVLSWLIITGSFACGMAFHNTTARYLYSLGRERVLPTALGRTHEKHKSPHIASTTQSVIAAVIVRRVRALRDDGFGLRLGHLDRLRPALRAHGVHGRRPDPVHPGARLGGHLELLPDAPSRVSTTSGRTRSPR